MVPTKVDGGVVWGVFDGEGNQSPFRGSGRGSGKGPLWDVGKMLTVLL